MLHVFSRGKFIKKERKKTIREVPVGDFFFFIKPGYFLYIVEVWINKNAIRVTT
jgi:hypothetical protein